MSWIASGTVFFARGIREPRKEVIRGLEQATKAIAPLAKPVERARGCRFVTPPLGAHAGRCSYRNREGVSGPLEEYNLMAVIEATLGGRW